MERQSILPAGLFRYVTVSLTSRTCSASSVATSHRHIIMIEQIGEYDDYILLEDVSLYRPICYIGPLGYYSRQVLTYNTKSVDDLW